LEVLVKSFQTAEPVQLLNVPRKIFGAPLRRDLIQKYFFFFKSKKKKKKKKKNKKSKKGRKKILNFFKKKELLFGKEQCGDKELIKVETRVKREVHQEKF